MSSVKPKTFELRGDLGILKSGSQSDCDLIAGDHKFHVHRAILASRGGCLEKLLNADGEGQAENAGKQVITVESHSAKSVDLVLEFIYGASKIEDVEYPDPSFPMIQNCILLYSLGHDFEIMSLAKYAVYHLGTYLSRKLKEICIYPLANATKAAGRAVFIEDLEAGIIKADEARLAHEERKLPLRMLTDFVVVARDVLLREPHFRLSIDQDVLPSTFVKDVLLAQFNPTYDTNWMKNLMKQPQKQTLKRRKCAGCGEGVDKDEQVVFNPWSGTKFSQRYSQVCCQECAEGMDKGNGKGVSWEVFDDNEE